ncbi:hypothetical protein GYMLUDRAFT_930695 [Collybiopsis luxurians FD-317 M1]|nr:hypothetical protein GYMLUDRAFT_930695 [Collybiopsis luxurians FD-317 M1]
MLVVQVNASPLRITLVGPEGSPNNETSVVQTHPKVFARPPPPLHAFGMEHKPKNETRPGCPGGAAARFRQKAIKISNALRLSMGMPLIEPHTHGLDRHHHHHDGEPEGMGAHPDFHGHDNESEKEDEEKVDGEGRVHQFSSPHHYHDEWRLIDDIEEPPFLPPPPHHVPPHHKMHFTEDDDEEPPFPPPPPPHPHHHHHGHHKLHHPPGPFHFHHHPPSFSRRLHFALHVLGPWEGRAAVFIIGCGLASLFRVLWVLAAISYRAIKGATRSDDEEVQSHVVLGAPAPSFVAPPVYIVDEKNVPFPN